MIFTLYGDIVHRGDRRDEGGALPVAALIALMASFEISPAAVRQALSRTSRQGWLQARRTGNRAFYSVTERGRRRIAELSPRIYGPIIEWDGIWRSLIFAGSDRGRRARDRLRQELSVLGWAPLSNSTWLAPADSLASARAAAEVLGLGDVVHGFTGSYHGPLSDAQLIARCWNLEHIAGAYREFIARYRPRLTGERERAALDDETAFVERLWLVHDFRKFTYVDPGLPSELVPAHWPRTTAAALFREYYAALGAKSERFFRTAIDAI
ncbi:MAG: PaaX family transcriptional regulator C-terminal domain-containing protein [Candidatus Tumulicola sp.]